MTFIWTALAFIVRHRKAFTIIAAILAILGLWAGFNTWLAVHDSRTADRAVEAYKAEQINNAYKIRKRQDALIPPSVSDTVNSMREGTY